MSRPADNHETNHVEESTEKTHANEDIVISVDELSLAYPSSDGIVVSCEELHIPRGQITALIGPNGSGKSTLLKALSNHLQPHSGEVSLDGLTIQEYDRKAFARKLSRLSQESDSPGDISVEDLVHHGRYPYRGFFDGVSEEDVDAVERAIDLAGVDHLREKPVRDLSGGQKQLVWMAVVLAQETDVLLLDEPTTFLDLKHQLQVMETIHRLNEQREITVVVVLHDIEQAAHNADYLFALSNGEIKERGDPHEVVTEAFLADVFEIDAEVQREPTLRIHPQRPITSSDGV